MRFSTILVVLLLQIAFAFSTLAQVAWYRSIGGDTLSIRSFDTYPLANGDYFITGGYRGIFNLNEGSSFPPMWIESLVDENDEYPTDCYFVARFSAVGQCLSYWRIDPEDFYSNVEVSKFEVVNVNENGETLIVIYGDALGNQIDLDPGPNQVLTGFGARIPLALYSGAGELIRSGFLDNPQEMANFSPSISGFLVHWTNVSASSQLDIAVPPATQELGLSWSNGEVGVMAQYNWDFELQWYRIVGLEENSAIYSNYLCQLEDGRVVWLIHNSDQFDVDMDLGSGSSIIGNHQNGIIIYDQNGNYLNSKAYSDGIIIVGLNQVSQDEIRFFGTFQAENEPIDFDFGEGTALRNSFTNNRDIFIASYDLDLNFNWVNVALSSGNLYDIGGSVSNSSNCIGFRHGIGNYDLDASSPGFYLLESQDSDAYTIIKTDMTGAPLVHLETSVYLNSFSFSNNHETGIIARNVGPGEPLLSINNVVYPLQVTTSLTNGLQLAGMNLSSSASVRGSVFLDADNDGMWDASEMGLSGQKIKCLENSGIVTTDSSGNYLFPLAAGDFSFEIVLPLYHTVSTSQSMPIAVQLLSDTVVDFTPIGVYPTPNITDLVADVSLINPLQPGFASSVVAQLENVGTATATGSFTVKFPTIGAATNFSPTPTSLSNDSATWALNSLPPFASFSVSFSFTTDIDVNMIGDTAFFTSIARTVVNDQTPSDNSRNLDAVVVGSFDPNDKTVSPTVSLTTSAIATASEQLTYLIRFQNTGNFPTSFVHLIDSLSADLDVSTFRMIASSHPCQFDIDPAGVVTWGFEPLILPDSASDPEGSSGYVLFAIKIAENTTTFQDIFNKAYIYFDFNPPIITVPSVFSFQLPNGIQDVERGMLGIFPNPSFDQATINYRAPNGTRPTLQVCDMLGRIKLTVQLPKNEGSYRFDTAKFGTGIYFCSLIQGVEVLATQKLVVSSE